jgi:hypothetical protein
VYENVVFEIKTPLAGVEAGDCVGLGDTLTMGAYASGTQAELSSMVRTGYGDAATVVAALLVSTDQERVNDVAELPYVSTMM